MVKWEDRKHQVNRDDVYEQEKRKLENMPLTSKEYEQEIRRLAQILKI